MNQLIGKATPAAEYAKIRSYVISQIAKSGDIPMRLASNREIAKQFGVSQPTVVRALKVLIDEGFITVKPGRLGAFTCPKRLGGRNRSKIIGIVTADGKWVFLSRYLNRMTFELTDALLEISGDYRLQHLFMSGVRDKAADEIIATGIDAVIWISALDSMLPAMEKLKAAGICQISACRENVDGVSNIVADVFSEYKKATGLMLDEGRRRVGLLQLDAGNRSYDNEAVHGWRAAYAERGIPCDSSLIMEHSDALLQNFEQVLGSIKPDGICFTTMIEDYYGAVTRKLDIVNECRLYSIKSNISHKMTGFIGYVGCPKMQEAAASAAEKFAALLESGNSSDTFSQAIETDIKMETLKLKEGNPK